MPSPIIILAALGGVGILLATLTKKKPKDLTLVRLHEEGVLRMKQEEERGERPIIDVRDIPQPYVPIDHSRLNR